MSYIAKENITVYPSMLRTASADQTDAESRLGTEYNLNTRINAITANKNFIVKGSTVAGGFTVCMDGYVFEVAAGAIANDIVYLDITEVPMTSGTKATNTLTKYKSTTATDALNSGDYFVGLAYSNNKSDLTSSAFQISDSTGTLLPEAFGRISADWVYNTDGTPITQELKTKKLSVNSQENVAGEYQIMYLLNGVLTAGIKINESVSAPTTSNKGNPGDIWIQYEN